MLEQFFQTLPIPSDQMVGTYSIRLVLLSYIVATAASYVALDISSRMRKVSISPVESTIWLIGGALAMGAGIWAMHFIGMLAFLLPMTMIYDPALTVLSIIVAVIASGFAFALLRPKKLKSSYLLLGGVLLGFGIAAMHYIGMTAMTISVQIHYKPSVFMASIFIAIFASEAALYFALKSTHVDTQYRFLFKIIGALVMGGAICGMHYTGMAAAIFTPIDAMRNISKGANPETIAIIIAIVSILILGVAITIASFQEALSDRSVQMARQSGMAEVASSVLHNVGNVLNSVNVSSSLIKNHLKKIDIEKLMAVNQMLDEHQQDLGEFMSSDPKGLRLPGYLKLLANKWIIEYQSLNNELDRLEQNIQHIKEIVSLQQSYGGIINFAELLSLETILDEALTLTSINFLHHKITIKKEYAKLKSVFVDKLKLTQVVINLICNAKESCQESTNEDKCILLKTGSVNDDLFFIQIIDNGIGINKTKQLQVFSYGFTTKKSGHGFGLHSSIIAINEMNGSLTVHSDGANKGATFTIELPYEASRSNGK